MRMSRSPQNGGFHRCTGGAALAAACRTTPAMASSRPVLLRPSFAMVSRNLSLPPGRSRDRDRIAADPAQPQRLGEGLEGCKPQGFTILLWPRRIGAVVAGLQG